MKNTPAEVRKRIEEMLQDQARQFDDINKKIAAERKAEADARAAIEQAVADLDFDRNHKAKRDLEEAIERRELLSKRAELYRSRKLVTEEESDKVISTIALGKAFSFSGNNANAIIKNPELREAFEEQKYADHFGSIDPLAYAAHIGGYTAEGKDWLDELIQVIRTNNSLFMDFFRRYRIQVTVPEAGYVLWADFRSLGMEEKELFDFLTNEAYFFVDPGEEYYGTPCNARICTAVPTSEVRKTIKRLEEAFTARGFHAGR